MSTRLALSAIAVLLALITAAPSSATELVPGEARRYAYEHVGDPEGYIVAVPKLSRYAVITDLQVATEQLSSRQAYIAYKTKRPLGIGGALIVAVVPGGLLYGAYKLRQWTLYRSELTALEEHLRDFRADATRLAASGYGDQVALAEPF